MLEYWIRNTTPKLLINKGEVIWANIRSEEERFFKIMKYVKNADMCDMTIFNSAKTKYYKK